MDKAGQLSIGEQAVVNLHEINKLYGVRYSTVMGGIIGLAVGSGVYNGIKELGFPGNDKYEELQGQNNLIQKRIDAVSPAIPVFTSEGRTQAASDAQQLITNYTAEIAENRSKFPSGYNPHIEGAFSVTGGVLTGLFLLGAVRYFIRKKAEGISKRLSDS